MAGLYGDWEVGEAEAPKKKRKTRKPSKHSTGPVAGTEYKSIKGEDYVKTKEHKEGKKFYQRRDNPYKGRKSDLAWLKKHGKARVSGGND